MWILNTSETVKFTGGNLPVVKEEEEDSGSSSSIGNNSDALTGGDDSDEDEVQSKDDRLMNNMNDLEQVLPIKYGDYS